jgi:hypothetical protein
MTIERSAITVYPYSIDQDEDENNRDAEIKSAGRGGWPALPIFGARMASLGKDYCGWLSM